MLKQVKGFVKEMKGIDVISLDGFDMSMSQWFRKIDDESIEFEQFEDAVMDELKEDFKIDMCRSDNSIKVFVKKDMTEIFNNVTEHISELEDDEELDLDNMNVTERCDFVSDYVSYTFDCYETDVKMYLEDEIYEYLFGK